MSYEIKKSNVCDQIVEIIKEKIISGELKANEQLPNERQLATNFGVSRISVREALRSLRQTGYIYTKHGEGTFVKEINSDYLSNALSAYLSYGNRPVIEVMEIRETLEVRAAGLAAERADEQDIIKIEECKKKVEEEVEKLRKGEKGDFHSADLAFHGAICLATKNTLFEKLLEALRDTLEIHQRWSISEPNAYEKVNYYHNEICKAIKERKPDQARKFMNEHIALLENVIIKHLNADKKQQN